MRCWQRKVWDHKTLTEERGPRKDAGPLLNSALAKISVRRRQDAGSGQRAALRLLVDTLNSLRTMNRWNEVAIDSPLYSRATSVCSGSAMPSSHSELGLLYVSTSRRPSRASPLPFRPGMFQLFNSVSHKTFQRVAHTSAPLLTSFVLYKFKLPHFLRTETDDTPKNSLNPRSRNAWCQA